MPIKMDGTSGQTMDQLGLGGVDANTMDWIDPHNGNEIQRIPTKWILNLD